VTRPPKIAKRTIGARVPESLADRFARIAEARCTTVSELLRAMVEDVVRAEDEGEPTGPRSRAGFWRDAEPAPRY